MSHATILSRPAISTANAPKQPITEDDIFTLKDLPGRFEPLRTGEYASHARGKWRFAESKRLINGEEEKSPRGVQEATYFSSTGESAWFIEVGIVDAADKEEDGQLVWRGTYTDTSKFCAGHKAQELQELEILKDFIAESLETFGTLRLKYGMDSEDRKEVLEEFGQILESRAKEPLSKVSKKSYGVGSKVFLIVPADYKNLQHDHIPEDVSTRTAASPYFWQLRPSEPNSRTAKTQDTQYLNVAFDIQESKAGKITAEGYPVMPWSRKEIEDFPDWVTAMFAENPSGISKEHRRRCDQAVEDGAKAFIDFLSRVTSGTTSSLEKGWLARRQITNPENYRLHSLQDFIVSSLQRERESIATSVHADAASSTQEQDSGPSPRRGKGRVLAPRVSGLSRLDDWRRALIDRTGIFESRDLSGGEAPNALFILQIIDESIKLSKEAAAKDRRRMEREGLREQDIERDEQALRAQRGAPPSYEGGPQGERSSGTQGDWTVTSVLSKTSEASDVKSFPKPPLSLREEDAYPPVSQAQITLGAGGSTTSHLAPPLSTAQLPHRRRSRSSLSGLWCFGGPRVDDD